MKSRQLTGRVLRLAGQRAGFCGQFLFFSGSSRRVRQSKGGWIGTKWGWGKAAQSLIRLVGFSGVPSDQQHYQLGNLGNH